MENTLTYVLATVIPLVLAYLFRKRGQKNIPVATPFPFDQHVLTE